MKKSKVKMIIKLITKIKALPTLILIGVMCSLITTNCYADEVKEHSYLIQMINQLNAIQPLIIAAEKEQPKNLRIQFHYTKFQDNQGQWHNGLLEDVQAIKAGIQEKLNQVSVEPRTIHSIEGDYMPLKKAVAHE